MIKTVKGVTAKLTIAMDMGYKYCKVAVDNNSIGCALIKDILDSINYCNTPGGKIRTFIHRGYEYAVDEGIEIKILTDEEFLEHYMGLPCNKGKQAKEEERAKRDVLSALKTEDTAHLSGRSGAMDALPNTLRAKPTAEREEEETHASESQKPKAAKKPSGFWSRVKNWVKGDVGYKK